MKTQEDFDIREFMTKNKLTTTSKMEQPDEIDLDVEDSEEEKPREENELEKILHSKAVAGNLSRLNTDTQDIEDRKGLLTTALEFIFNIQGPKMTQADLYDTLSDFGSSKRLVKKDK